MTTMNRRHFLSASLAAALAAPLAGRQALAAALPGSKMRLGLVTYLWGQHWDLETLIGNCEKSGVLGVELRTTHAHGVERELTKAERAAVKQRFEDSPAVHVGIGSNERFDHKDEDGLKAAIQATKDFVVLSHDTGGSGVKVKPNSFHDDVPIEQTTAQIAKALNEVGEFAGNLGQEIRVEVHGRYQEPPLMKAIMDQVTDKNVGICWNSNPPDLEGEGLAYNFNLLKDRFGATAHIRELNVGSYPYQELMDMFVAMDYDGWILLEAREKITDGVAALLEQREVFNTMIKNGQAKV